MNGPEFAVIPQVVEKKSLKQKIILWVSISLSVVLVLGAAYAALIYYVLLDFVTMPYITYSYRSDLENKDEITVTIDRVNYNSDYPEKFFIPRKLSGYRVTAIGESAFAGLDRLKEVTFPETINYIGQDAFNNCINLETFNIPKDLTYIGMNAFHNTKYLANQLDGPVSIGPILYTYNGDLPEDTAIVKSEDSPAIATHANYFSLEPFVQLGAGVFESQPGITYVELPDDLETISDKLFYNNTELVEVHLGENNKHIGGHAFSGAKKLHLLEWSDELITIGEYAFKDTNFIGEVVLGKSLTFIGEGAFQNSQEMTKIVIPKGVSEIKDYVFDGCESLEEIVLDAKEHSVESKITYLGKAALRKTAITNFTIPFSVRTLQESAFESTPNLETVYVYNNTEETFRTETVYDEEEAKFVQNQIQQGLTKITSNVFNNSTSFKELVLINKNGEVESPLNRVTLPETLRQLGEKNSLSNMFSNTLIETLDLRGQITFIAPSLAKDATHLNEVIIGEDSAITAIYKEAFMHATSLVNFTFPNATTSVDASAFEGASSLETVVLPTNENFITLDSKLFKDATSLTTIVIPSNVRAIKNQVFENCTSLRVISIPSSVTTMGRYVFNGCHSDLVITINVKGNNMRNWDANWLGANLVEEDNVVYINE